MLPGQVFVVHPYLRNVVYKDTRRSRMGLVKPSQAEAQFCSGQGMHAACPALAPLKLIPSFPTRSPLRSSRSSPEGSWCVLRMLVPQDITSPAASLEVVFCFLMPSLAVALTESLGWPVEEAACITVNTVNPAQFLGKGKVPMFFPH